MKSPIVIKIGGSVLDSLSLLWSQVRQIQSPVVIVHGGGVQSTELAHRLDHTPTFIGGRRVTRDLDLKIAEWAMRGAVNMKLVATANTNGLKAVGLSGVDGAMIKVRRREPWMIHGKKVDFGWVGEIVSIDTTLIHTLTEVGFISIIAPLGVDDSGQRYNVNADTVACTLAEVIHAKELLMVTDSGGVLRDLNNPSSLLKTCSPEEEVAGLEQGWISDGMSVKLHSARRALAKGVSDVWVLGVDDLLHKRNATLMVMES